jgi:hypothetical protein
MSKDRDQLLAELKRHKANRHPSEIAELLALFGFVSRKTKKGHTVWTKGAVTLTVPEPHGREKVLLVQYVQEVIRKIEEASEPGSTPQPALRGEVIDEEDA